MTKKKKLAYVLMEGDGIGRDFAKSLQMVQQGITTIEFEVVPITKFRLETGTDMPGELDPRVAAVFKRVGVGMKGPTRTLEGTGPRSANVALREILNLHLNIRPVKYMKGMTTPVKNPEDLDVIIFRQNTEDVYMGIEAKAGSLQAREMITFVKDKLNKFHRMFTTPDEVGIGVKLVSRTGSETLMRNAIEYALAHGRKKICIVHKGNIMKHTEGAFKKWCEEYAIKQFRNSVYLKSETEQFTAEEKSKRLFIDTCIADDAFAQLLRNPKRFDIIVAMNLNGDYLSDAAAAQVGGVPTAAGGNIGDDCAIFEAIGGTADDIAGQDKANPTAFLLAFAMMLEYKGFDLEAKALREAIAQLYEKHIGTADMHFETVLTSTEFSEHVRDLVKEIIFHETTPVEAGT